jgi:imidazolonepropionase
MDLRITDIDELCTLDPGVGEGTLGILRNAAVAFAGGRCAWVGPSQEAPDATVSIDGSGCVGVPGLVDCHTHSLFAGSRAEEFSQRLAGATYTEILEAGGGILSTVAATRAASTGLLTDLLRKRLGGFLAAGVTTVEVKTGYGLHPEHEIRMLRLLREEEMPTRVVSTFLGAHAVPEEFRGDRAAYVTCILEEMLPEAIGLADCVDVYCDRGAFSLEETDRILRAGMAGGLVGRVHAEQVEYTGAAQRAAELGCASADHLERIDPQGIESMAAHGTIGVLLPGAMTYLGDAPPPVAELLEAGVELAVATDFNPGSSPVRDLWACATLACIRMGLSVEQALVGITRNAGRALGRADLGWLGPGSVGDFALVAPPPGEPVRHEVLVQYMGGHRATVVVRDGRPVVGSKEELS